MLPIIKQRILITLNHHRRGQTALTQKDTYNSIEKYSDIKTILEFCHHLVLLFRCLFILTKTIKVVIHIILNSQLSIISSHIMILKLPSTNFYIVLLV